MYSKDSIRSHSLLHSSLKGAKRGHGEAMKTFEGEKGNGMTEEEARRFLTESKSILILGTTSADGAPVIHPVWYYFDSAESKLYFYTEPELRKAKNIKARSHVYFDVDYDK